MNNTYNPVGDRIQKNVTPLDVNAQGYTEDYIYDQTKAQLMSVQTNGTNSRIFRYAATGQVNFDRRDFEH